jgi:ribosome-associated protein
MESIELLNLIAQTIFDKKGFNIFAIDVRGISTLSDFLLIAEGSVDRHVKAICESVQEVTAKRGVYPLITEGEGSCDWCVLDYGDIMIHLFQPDIRQRYSLEELWSDGKIINLQIDIHKSL